MPLNYNDEARAELIDGYVKEFNAGWDLETTERVIALALRQPLGPISTEGYDESEVDENDMTPRESVILGLSYFGLDQKYTD